MSGMNKILIECCSINKTISTIKSRKHHSQNIVMTEQSKETVLITGGSGLVGKAIEEEVIETNELGNRFTFIYLSSGDADLTDFEQTRGIFEKFKPSYVINLAAKVGGLYANLSDNESFYKTNKSINENVLICSSEFKVKKCLSCLSTCIFPAQIGYPLDESKIHQGPPHDSNKGYSMAKREVDLLNQHYNRIHRDDSLFTAIIPTNVYGRHDNFNLTNCHVVPGLVHKAYLGTVEAKSNHLNQAVLKVCGSGEPLRQFIFARDLAKLIIWALFNYSDQNPLILCPDECDEISIGYIANTIADIFSRKMNVSLKVEYDITQSDGQYKKTASNRKLRSLNQKFTFTAFEIGIHEVIDWFCSNYPQIRM